MTAPILLDQARIAYQANRLDTAEALCRAAGAETDGGDRAAALLLLAHIHRRRGQTDAAAETVAAVLRDDPASIPAAQAYTLMRALMSAGQARNWILIPGVPRNLPEFTAVLNGALALRAEGLADEILLSTWTGQFSGNPGIARELEKHRVLWIESPEPRITLAGHIIHQMKAFMAGLNACPPGSRVLKLRTDKVPMLPAVWEGFRNALGGGLDREIGGGAGGDPAYPTIFSERVAVTSFGNFANLFCMNDITFFGRREDLLTLANMDARFFERFRSMAPEQWYFAHPFIDRFPIFQSYFRIPLGMTHSADLRRRLLAASLKNDTYARMVMSYAHLVSHYFRVGMQPRTPQTVEVAAARCRGLTYEELLFTEDHGLGSFSAHVPDDLWLAPFLTNGMRPSPLGDRLQQAGEAVRPYAFHTAANPAEIDADLEISGFHAAIHTLAASEPGTWFNTNT